MKNDKFKKLVLEMSKEDIVDMYEKEIWAMEQSLVKLHAKNLIMLDGLKSIRDSGLGHSSCSLASEILERVDNGEE